MDFNSINVLAGENIEKRFNNNFIKLIPNFDSITILIETNAKDSYESYFKQNELNKLFMTNKSIYDLINFISLKIDKNEINIETNDNYLKLIFTKNNIELTLNKKYKSNEEKINILFKEINNLKDKNDELNEKIELQNNEIKQQKIILEQNTKIINELNKKIIILEKNIDIKNNKIFNKDENNNEILNKKEKKNEILNKEEKSIDVLYNKEKSIDVLYNKEKSIDVLYNEENEKLNNPFDKRKNDVNFEELNKEKDENEKKLFNENVNQIKIENSLECNIKLNQEIAFKDGILSISFFPSGNMISISSNLKNYNMEIRDIHFNIIGIIKDTIKNIFIKIRDENNFISFSDDYNILKYWTKKNNKFEIQYIIQDPHKEFINKMIYYKNYLITCSKDSKIKIWELNNKFILKETLSQSKSVNSILFIEEKNLLISSGDDGTYFWDTNFTNKTKKNSLIKKVKCLNKYTLKRYDKNNIIICDDENNVFIISLQNKNIIKKFDLKIQRNIKLIKIIQEKEIILILDSLQYIRVFNAQNFSLINTIKYGHLNSITGIKIKKNNTFISYSLDGYIKIWEISY